MANSKGIPRDPEKKARSRIGIFSIVMVLLVTLLMLLEAMAGTAPVQSNNPTAASANIQPSPMLNTNVTWSTFHSGWNPLEYSNGSANLTLNAQESSLYANPISINPEDIQANGTLTYDKLGLQTIQWENTSLTANPGTSGGAVATTGVKDGHITFSVNTTNAGSDLIGTGIENIPVTDFPSANLQYDYFTMIVGFSGADLTGTSAHYSVGNLTTPGSYPTYIYPGQIGYFSENLAQIQQQQKYSVTYNTTGRGTASWITVQVYINTPQSSSNDLFTFTIYGMAFTEYPLTLGQNATGATINTFNGKALTLSTFHPSFTYQSVTNGGYTVSVSQPMQNLTTQQSAVSLGNYVEQVEYQGGFALPTAPDLSYGAANLTEQFNISTTQVQVLDINGVSYLATISGKNGTVQLLSSINPNSQTQFLQIVDYTQSQWTSISSPPGIFTIQGIEYYWEEFIIAVLAVVGLGAGAASKHASSLRKVK